ncbi:uncharacterized protein EAE98_002672 [Botrytis deweyae]|uniref:Autophagy-related protein 29 n=1 Tax=Botrytis deweyae TaxID=2478750 RepID=A0ABQ7IV64_9HELO|nr:uncharacterized protein EAE98_002672 [Botrytis deweyae]KAF7917538.1 hypothetical protein EAE99_009204 [Botrytis elliptica]KAF7934627.1 hypothetical protein EAE98_002672 [Botrytis deweyae]
MSNSDAESDPTYTVFVKLPFPRGDFVDPPAVEWDAGKDKALWKILLKAPKNSDVDWTALATKFEVTLPFLLQQVAWLYERQFSQVREQMRKATVSKGSLAPSPVPDSISEQAGGEEMRRTGSGGGGPRIQSSLSNRKSTPFSKNDGSVPNTPNRAIAPPFSRTSSRETTVQSRTFVAPSSRPTQATTNRRSLSPKQRSRPPSLAIDHPPRNSPQPAQLSSPEDSSDDDPYPFQSTLLNKRFPSIKKTNKDPSSDDELAFLPTPQDPSATLRIDPRNPSRRTSAHPKKLLPVESQTSDSSTSSSAPIVNKRHDALSGGGRRPLTGPLSPRRTTELQSERSDGGTPSMGSSFSDLDDASVTQSALEEALASNMQAGGMASRMSTISQALRSRYL